MAFKLKSFFVKCLGQRDDLNHMVRFPDGFDPRVDTLPWASTPGYKADEGIYGAGILAGVGTALIKRGPLDTDWDILEAALGSHDFQRMVGNALVPASALPGSATKVVNTSDPGGFSFTDGRACLVRVRSIAVQKNSPKGAVPEGADGNLFSLMETFTVINDGVTLHIFANSANPNELHTTHKLFVDGPTGAPGSNDGDMGLEYVAIDKNTIEVRAFNGTDNGGGDSGREMQWAASISKLDEMEVPL